MKDNIKSTQFANLISIYANLIKKGIKTIDNVPNFIDKEIIKETLIAQGNYEVTEK